MKHIDLVRALQSPFSQPALNQLSERFGLSADILRHVIAQAAPALVSALMAAGTIPEAVEELFAALMSPQANGRIVDELTENISTTAGLKVLEGSGHSFIGVAMRVAPSELSDFVAAVSGIPTQAAYAMTGVIAAVLSGVLKHHILLERSPSEALPQLLAAQWPSVESHFSDALARTLRFENAAMFRDTIPAQLRVLAGNLRRAEATKSKEPESSAAPTYTTAPSTKRKMTICLSMIAAGVAILACGIYYAGPLQSAIASNNPFAPQKLAVRATTVDTRQEVKGASAPSPIASDANASASMAFPASVVSGEVITAAVGASSSADGAAATSSTAPITTPPEKPHHARFGFGVGRNGVASVYATVTGSDEESRLLQILDRGLGVGHYTADVAIDADASTDWFAHSEELIPLMRIARADMSIDDRNIELGGAATGDQWVSRIKTSFGDDYTVGVFAAAEAVSTAMANFNLAAEDLLKSGSCDSVDRVLNTQIIDFARGSAHVPQSATGNLALTAKVLSACAARGQAVVLTIQSFTDDIGDEKSNLDLSRKRALAVKTFLVERGVPAASLATVGLGVSRPVAANTTERGRFENRRVLFVPGSRA
jgi:outer membrane protein OmpA-like peptidoglycan-associated protein